MTSLPCLNLENWQVGRINRRLSTKASSQVLPLLCAANHSIHVYNMRKSKGSCQLDRQNCFVFFVLSADTWLSQPPDHFQSSLGYKSQQDSALDFIYHRPWIITGLSLSLAVMTYFRCSHTLHNQICASDDLVWSFIS